MEHDFSFNKQLRKEITARAVMDKNIKMLEVDIHENNKKRYDVHKAINTMQKATRRRNQKDSKYLEISSSVNGLQNLKTDIRNIKGALKQLISHIKEVKDGVGLKIKEVKKKIKSIH